MKKQKKALIDMFKKILEGGSSTKKVDAFLGGNQIMAQNFNNPAGLPQDLYEATMRQYGRKEFGDYTTDDMKLIIHIILYHLLHLVHLLYVDHMLKHFRKTH